VTQATIEILALQRVVSSGGHSYPMYIGFLPAEEIALIAESPSFQTTTSNDDIATDVLAPSHKRWQRPISNERTAAIAHLFSGAGEFMPNPVLLSENIDLNGPSSGAIAVNQIAVGSVATPAVRISITLPTTGASKPLWILDGQHRIFGLAKSAQRRDYVPLVLLLNQGHPYYGGSTLAKIFAQVTTEAKPLGPLHNEWLTYAFNLDKYASHTPTATEYSSAMRAVGLLCTTPQFKSASGVMKPNPFKGRIQFNDYKSPGAPAPGGFTYTCQEMTLLFRNYYFGQPVSGTPRLSSDRFTEQFLLAHEALVNEVPAPHSDSVFFGGAFHGQKIMWDAFIAGIASHLLRHGVPASWKSILQALNFQHTNWNFSTWVVSLSAAKQTGSRKVAAKVFQDAFRDIALPPGTLNLGDYLQGDRALIQLSAFDVSANGRIKRKSTLDLKVDGGSTKTTNVYPRKRLKITFRSSNIASITVTDKDSPPGRLVDYSAELKGGLDLKSLTTNPVRLLVRFHYYGGVEQSANVDVQW